MRVTPSPTPIPDVQPQKGPRPDNPVEQRALYFPNKKVYGQTPDSVEIVTLKTQDGLALEAWYLAPPKDGYLLLYFHGNGGNLTGLSRLFKIFEEAGLGVLAVDYRGFGNSDGAPSEEGLYLDGLAAYDYALTRHDVSRLVIHGRSLGGGVASYVAQKKPCLAVVLESTFTSAQDVAAQSHGEKARTVISAFDTLSRMKDITVPVLILHGTEDQVIPSSMSEKLHEATPNSTLWMIEGANHGSVGRTVGPQVYCEKILEFLKSSKK